MRKNEYPCKPQFYHIKVEFKGVFVTQTCIRYDMFSLKKCEKLSVRLSSNTQLICHSVIGLSMIGLFT